MTISTKKPSKNLGGYTITFDANGGTFAGGATTNEMVYSTDGTKVDGTYTLPNGEGSFIGWYTKDKDGIEYKVAENGKPDKPLTEDITVYAHYKPPMKYAVAIYGICVDDVVDEGTDQVSKGGLTFGPALGENYVQSSKEHTPSGRTKNRNEHRCVHNDDWKTIIEWNKNDPYVYEQCIKEGCTHSVALSKNTTTTILSEQFDPIKETGDGPSTLYYELVTNNGSCFENLRWHPNGGKENFGTNKDGWGATRIRAMLNGADAWTDKGVDKYSIYISSDLNKSASIYTPDNCLFATFPKKLQEAIGARQVKYDSVHDQNKKEYLKTTNDKLWLFSSNEVMDTIYYTWCEHPLEGTVYEKFKDTNSFSNDGRRPVLVNSRTGDSIGDFRWAWLRSVSGGSGYNVLQLDYAGCATSDLAYNYDGVSVGFTLKR